MKGWYGNRQQHRLASKGIRTKVNTVGTTENVLKNALKSGDIIIWDNFGETADRYTVLIDKRYVFGMDTRPFHPQGFNQYSGDLWEWIKDRNTTFEDVDDYIRHWDRRGDKRLNYDTIPSDVRYAIIQRMEDN